MHCVKLDQPLAGVHLWYLPLIPEWETYLDLLSPRERRRLLEVTDPQRKRQFATGRIGLRLLLADYLGRHPSSIDIGYTATGKPILQNHNYHFNLSHTGNLVVIALSHLPVGVDVECMQRVCAIEKIGKKYFPEQDWTGNDRQELFYELWTAREAIGKAVGTGLQVTGPVFNYAVHSLRIEDHGGTVYQLGLCRLEAPTGQEPHLPSLQ